MSGIVMLGDKQHLVCYSPQIAGTGKYTLHFVRLRRSDVLLGRIATAWIVWHAAQRVRRDAQWRRLWERAKATAVWVPSR